MFQWLSFSQEKTDAISSVKLNSSPPAKSRLRAKYKKLEKGKPVCPVHSLFSHTTDGGIPVPNLRKTHRSERM